MRIFIELPTWLGDTVMTTPAIEAIARAYPHAKFIFFGSFASIEALKVHPKASQYTVDESKRSFSRFYWLFTYAKSLGHIDIAISFRRSLFTKFMLAMIHTAKRFSYDKHCFQGHQVEKYVSFVTTSLSLHHAIPTGLKLYQYPRKYEKPTLGINPGATYGSAKRWYPEEFAKVAIHYAKEYDIILFGGSNEVNIALEIEAHIRAHGIENVINLAGKTSLQELIEAIGGLTLFVTNDSGPMHVAAAYQIPTVALFGPTKEHETSQWQNPYGYIISHHLACSPCMKRECPLKTHACMRDIKAEEVIAVLEHHRSLGK